MLADLADDREYHLPNTKRRIPTELDDEFDVKGQVWRLKGKFLLVVPYLVGPDRPFPSLRGQAGSGRCDRLRERVSAEEGYAYGKSGVEKGDG